MWMHRLFYPILFGITFLVSLIIFLYSPNQEATPKRINLMPKEGNFSRVRFHYTLSNERSNYITQRVPFTISKHMQAEWLLMGMSESTLRLKSLQTETKTSPPNWVYRDKQYRLFYHAIQELRPDTYYLAKRRYQHIPEKKRKQMVLSLFKDKTVSERFLSLLAIFLSYTTTQENDRAFLKTLMALAKETAEDEMIVRYLSWGARPKRP